MMWVIPNLLFHPCLLSCHEEEGYICLHACICQESAGIRGLARIVGLGLLTSILLHWRDGVCLFFRLSGR